MSSSSSPAAASGFDILPTEVIARMNYFLEYSDQNAFSETCKRLNSIVKSNLVALEDLKFLEENMISLDGRIVDYETILRDAVQKQDDAIYVREREEDEETTLQKQEEANVAALKVGVDISDGKLVAQEILKRKILGVFRDSQNLQLNSANAPIESSDISYEKTIKLRKDYLIELYKALCNCPRLKDQYESKFKTNLLPLESFEDLNDPILIEVLTTLYNRIKLLVIKDSFDLAFNRAGGQGLFNEIQQQLNVKNFDNEACNEIFAKFHNWIKKNSDKIAHLNLTRVISGYNVLNAMSLDLHCSLQEKMFPKSCVHIWKKEFFEPIFNCIPKDQLFNFLTKVDPRGYTLLDKASRTSASTYDSIRRTENGNPLFIKFLLEELDEGRRLEALQVVVDCKGTLQFIEEFSETIFHKILKTTSDLNLIKTILETVFKDPKEMTNYVKANIGAFKFELPRDKLLTDWIGTLFRQEIDSRFSDMNNGELFFYLRFYLACRDGKALLYVLKKISDGARRVDLILALFKNNWENPNYFIRDKVINKPDLIRILKLLPENESQAKFLQLTGYYLIINNEEVTAILRKEIAGGNYQYFEGLVQYGSIDHIAEFADKIPPEILKPIILNNFSFDQKPDVVRLLLSKLEKNERIQLIKGAQFSPNQIAKLNLYKLLYDLDILFECLLFTIVYKRGNPYLYSLMYCLVNAAKKELEKGGMDSKESLSYIFKSFEGKGRSEVIELLRTRVNRPSVHPTIYDRLIELYPESKGKLEEMFPGIDKEMDPKRKRSDASEEIDETARSKDDAKKSRVEDSEEE
ncbi:MAG: hypothetical protein KR126chlam4_00615 [Candidatus Anoxychlamydiales bacterium]|nr:hypothetical protein [Candidatus Anoxychlamydiales bacterium]